MKMLSGIWRMNLGGNERTVGTTLLWLTVFLAMILTVSAGKDMVRKSIVFDKNTPDVFYCPIHKPSGFDKLIVKARPLKKLCELEGKTIPEDYKSDCYQDVDESDYACKEKYRIMMRMHPPGSEEAWDGGERMAKFLNVDRQYYITKMGNQVKQVSKPQRRRGNARFDKKSYIRDRLGFY